jgi:hypothetical protein
MGGYYWFAFGLFVAAPVVAVIAHRKGRVAIAWFLYGFLMPPIALIHILASGPDRDVLEMRLMRTGKWQRCPSCVELIPREAPLCGRCGGDVAAERARKRRLPPVASRSPGVS